MVASSTADAETSEWSGAGERYGNDRTQRCDYFPGRNPAAGRPLTYITRLGERQVRLDASHVGLVDQRGFRHQALAFRTLGREQMTTRSVLTQDFPGPGDLESLGNGFPRLTTRNRFRHKARKIIQFAAVTTALRLRGWNRKNRASSCRRWLRRFGGGQAAGR